MRKQLLGLEREFIRFIERFKALDRVSVRDAAHMLGRSQAWVRANLPVIIDSPRRHFVRLRDIEAHNAAHTVRPEAFLRNAGKQETYLSAKERKAA